VDDDEGDDDTILDEPDIPLKEYSFHVSFGLKKKQRVDPFLLFKKLTLKMMQLDPSFKIDAYDRTQASDLWPHATPTISLLRKFLLKNILFDPKSINKIHRLP
jgi:hypothetical protein